MSYQLDHNTTHQCLVCGNRNARIRKSGGSNSGAMVETVCPDCKATGVISNETPWYGEELPIERLRALFTLAEIPILSDPLALQNRYWQGRDKAYYHPWWFVQTPWGWIEIGNRKRVMSIDWTHTTIRIIVTADEVTKDETCVHAWSEAKALEYLTVLARVAPVVESVKP